MADGQSTAAAAKSSDERSTDVPRVRSDMSDALLRHVAYKSATYLQRHGFRLSGLCDERTAQDHVTK